MVKGKARIYKALCDTFATDTDWKVSPTLEYTLSNRQEESVITMDCFETTIVVTLLYPNVIPVIAGLKHVTRIVLKYGAQNHLESGTWIVTELGEIGFRAFIPMGAFLPALQFGPFIKNQLEGLIQEYRERVRIFNALWQTHLLPAASFNPGEKLHLSCHEHELEMKCSRSKVPWNRRYDDLPVTADSKSIKGQPNPVSESIPPVGPLPTRWQSSSVPRTETKAKAAVHGGETKQEAPAGLVDGSRSESLVRATISIVTPKCTICFQPVKYYAQCVSCREYRICDQCLTLSDKPQLHWFKADRLLQSVAVGDLATVQKLLQGGADVNTIYKCLAPLLVAAGRGHGSMVDLLLEHKAVIDVPDITSPLLSALKRERADCALRLVRAGADMTQVDHGHDGYTALHWAVDRCYVNVVHALLVRDAALDVLDEKGHTPEDIAGIGGNVAVLTLLRLARLGELQSGVNTSIVTLPLPTSSTSLSSSSSSSSSASSPAAPKPQFVRLPSMEELIKEFGDKKHTKTKVFQAVSANNVDEVKRLLQQPRINVNAVDETGISLLLVAAARGFTEICNLLLEAKAHIDAKNANQDTPFSLAVSKSHFPTAFILLHAGADVNHVDKFGDTPIIDAARNGSLEMVRALLAKGARRGHTNKAGQKAVDVAKVRGYHDIANLLHDPPSLNSSLIQLLPPPTTLASVVAAEVLSIYPVIKPLATPPPASPISIPTPAVPIPSPINTTPTTPMPSESSVDLQGDLVTIGAQIGQGEFGGVWEGKYLATECAIKVLPDRFASDKKSFDIFLKEVALHRSLIHPHVVMVMGVACKKLSTGQDQYYLLQGLCKMGSLHKLLHDNTDEKTLSIIRQPNIRLSIAKNIAAGLQFLHNRKILHLDIKPGHILIDHNCEAKITDFGTSQRVDRVRTTSQKTQTVVFSGGTTLYAAPEILLEGQASWRSDVFSYGIVLYELFTQLIPYGEEMNTAGFELSHGWNLIQPTYRPKWPERFIVTHPIREIAEQCWAQDPDQRPPMTEVLDMLEHISLASL